MLRRYNITASIHEGPSIFLLIQSVRVLAIVSTVFHFHHHHSISINFSPYDKHLHRSAHDMTKWCEQRWETLGPFLLYTNVLTEEAPLMATVPWPLTFPLWPTPWPDIMIRRHTVGVDIEVPLSPCHGHNDWLVHEDKGEWYGLRGVVTCETLKRWMLEIEEGGWRDRPRARKKIISGMFLSELEQICDLLIKGDAYLIESSWRKCSSICLISKVPIVSFTVMLKT